MPRLDFGSPHICINNRYNSFTSIQTIDLSFGFSVSTKRHFFLKTRKEACKEEIPGSWKQRKRRCSPGKRFTLEKCAPNVRSLSAVYVICYILKAVLLLIACWIIMIGEVTPRAAQLLGYPKTTMYVRNILQKYLQGLVCCQGL